MIHVSIVCLYSIVLGRSHIGNRNITVCRQVRQQRTFVALENSSVQKRVADFLAGNVNRVPKKYAQIQQNVRKTARNKTGGKLISLCKSVKRVLVAAFSSFSTFFAMPVNLYPRCEFAVWQGLNVYGFCMEMPAKYTISFGD